MVATPSMANFLIFLSKYESQFPNIFAVEVGFSIPNAQTLGSNPCDEIGIQETSMCCFIVLT
jgi:hypothetical protein